MNDKLIDSIAALKKFGIENSGHTREEKEWAKSGVDCLSSVLKLMQQAYPNQNLSVMGLDIEQIRAVKQVAKQYAIEKVILFPCPNGQNIIPLIRVYGGDKEKFLQSFGWNSLQSNYQMEFSSMCDSLEKEYGITLYENI